MSGEIVVKRYFLKPDGSGYDCQELFLSSKYEKMSDEEVLVACGLGHLVSQEFGKKA